MNRLILILCFIFSCSFVKGQEPYQLVSTSKVMTTAFDTVKLAGFTYGKKQGFVTNEDIAYPLYVYFSYPGKTSLDSNSFVIVPAGLTFKYTTYGMRLFRRTTVGDGFKMSQVLQGKGVKYEGTVSFHGKNYVGRNFTGATIANLDLTGSDFHSANFTNAKFINCVLKNCDFTGATGITNEELMEGAWMYAIGEVYSFIGVDGSGLETSEP